ncbi:MAG: cupin domain-containing protein [Burkholderiales bacterium]|nr:cupin domain-containing protein [Burkholderiales bacterium]
MTLAWHTRAADSVPFVTKDGSSIRELMHPRSHGARAQSLAEATIEAGAGTALHRHRDSEELYHVIAGYGRMTLGARELEVGPGDTVCIRPGTAHRIANIGSQPLRILCCCSPCYRDEDTELL